MFVSLKTQIIKIHRGIISKETWENDKSCGCLQDDNFVASDTSWFVLTTDGFLTRRLFNLKTKTTFRNIYHTNTQLSHKLLKLDTWPASAAHTVWLQLVLNSAFYFWRLHWFVQCPEITSWERKNLNYETASVWLF